MYASHALYNKMWHSKPPNAEPIKTVMGIYYHTSREILLPDQEPGVPVIFPYFF